MITGSYTADGAKGLMKEGGSGRKAAVQKALEGIGGRLDAIYFTYGERDVLVICDVPDAVSGLALSIAANATGTVHLATTPLISVEELDAACKKSVNFRPAGS
jgi:uncharacterized protein with GYD domain